MWLYKILPWTDMRPDGSPWLAMSSTVGLMG